MSELLAQTLMEEFATDTGVVGTNPPRRYLWTDAFAVCNFLGLYRRSGEDRYLTLARTLVDQVHHVLGRHRPDDSRRGWLSGLSEQEGERHPTSGGLRIGKSLPERGPREPMDSQLEWDRDGQYFHYLTKWMHGLHRIGQETGEQRYHEWAVELATTAHRAFTWKQASGEPMRIMWKMSVDLTRPLVSSSGQHDPLDGLITCLELQAKTGFGANNQPELAAAIADMSKMSTHGHWATDDALGIGGLLDDASRLARLIFESGVERLELLHQLLATAELSLREFARSFLLRLPAGHRLAFRELGLSIGLHGLQRIADLVARDRELTAIRDRLLNFQPLADSIESFWSEPSHRLSRTWTDHRDINTVMLATSLAPEGYLRV